MTAAGPPTSAAVDSLRTAEPLPVDKFPQRLQAVIGLIFCTALLVNFYASWELRGYFADGSHWLVQMVSSGGFFLAEDARLTVDVLEELPAVVALRLGVADLDSLGILWGLTLQLLPIAFIAACYAALPRPEKTLFVYPLLFYLAGAQAAAFASIAPGATATGYFWLLLILIVYRARGPWSFLALAAAAGPALYAHEVMVLLAPVLAVAAARRARLADSAWARAGFALLAAWFVAVAAGQLGFTIYPRDPHNRTLFVREMIEFQFIANDYSINPPAVLGLAALILSPGLFLLRPAMALGRIRGAAWLLGGFGALCCVAAIGPLLGDVLFWPTLQFNARYLGAFLSLPLAGAMMVCAYRPGYRARWAKSSLLAILLLLAAGQFGWQAGGTYEWSLWIEAWRTVLGSHRGLIPWPEAKRALEPLLPAAGRGPTAKWEALGWAFPSLSLLLAPDGKVAAIIAAPPTRWQPFDPAVADTLPRSPLFDTSAYRAALAR